MAQRVKDPALQQLWHRSQLRLGFDPFPRNFHMLWMWLKRTKKKRKKEPDKRIKQEKNSFFSI